MTEYSKLKNAELENLLKARGLPHTGKKADMVLRLQEDDKKQSSNGDAPAVPTAPAEDEIDWDDDGLDASKADGVIDADTQEPPEIGPGGSDESPSTTSIRSTGTPVA